MARMPDGWVIVAESDKLGVEVRLRESRELVMCKNCVYGLGPDENGWYTCDNTGAGYPADGYCSDGERRDDDG